MVKANFDNETLCDCGNVGKRAGPYTVSWGAEYRTHKLYRADKPAANEVWLKNLAPNDLVA